MDNYKQQVIDYFNKRGKGYDQEGEFHPRYAARLLEYIPLSRGMKVLDLATGTGLLAIPAAQQVGKTGAVIGVDFSAGMLESAAGKIANLGLENITLIEADAENIEFEDNSFDVVFCSSALPYFKDILGSLQKWFNWLKIGGKLGFSATSEQSFLAPVMIKVASEALVTLTNLSYPTGSVEKCQDLLKKAGFKSFEIQVEQWGSYLDKEDNRLKWDGMRWFERNQKNPLIDLSVEEREQLQKAYQRELEQRLSDQGLWYEMLMYFVMAQK